MRITVDPGQMSYSGNEIHSEVNFLRSNMDAITTLVQGLDGDWKGDAGAAYVSRILNVRSEFKRVENFIEEMADLLLRFSEEYERHEDELYSKINSI